MIRVAAPDVLRHVRLLRFKPPRYRLAVVGLVVMIVGASCAFAALSRVLNTGDETAHMDYAYQVWLGRLPVFEHGLLFRPPTANVPPVQWESQHPPLFYVLAAPIVGPLINGGHWLVATMAGRGLCVVIAALCVVALSWAGSLVSMQRRLAWAIVVPATVAPMSLFMRVGGSFYIDNLATLLSVLAVGVGIQVVRSGLTVRRVVMAAALAAAGMLTEATFIVTLLTLVGALVLGTWMHDRGSRAVRIGRSAVIGAIPLAAAAASSGWFYLRNRRLTGSLLGQHNAWAAAHLHRHSTSAWQVATSPGFWRGNLQLFRQSGGIDAQLSQTLVEIVIGCAVIGWLVALTRRRLAGFDRCQAAVVLVLVVQGVGTVLTEIGYSATGGSVNARYLLPGLLPLGCLLAAGILALPRRLIAPALAVYLGIAWGCFLHWAWVQPITTGSHLTGHTANGVGWALVLLALAGLVVGGLAQVWALLDRRVLGPLPAAGAATDGGGNQCEEQVAGREQHA